MKTTVYPSVNDQPIENPMNGSFLIARYNDLEDEVLATANEIQTLDIELTELDGYKELIEHKIDFDLNGIVLPSGMTYSRRGTSNLTLITEEIDGRIGLKLDGSTGIIVQNASALDVGLGEYTLEFWYRYDETCPADAALIGLGTSGRPCYITSTEAWIAYTLAFAPDTYISIGALQPDVWSHIALCRRADVFSTYLDGVFVESYERDIWNISNTSLIIGSLLKSGATYAKGYISDIILTMGAKY